MDVSPTLIIQKSGNLSPLIPESVEQMMQQPVLVTPPSTQKSPVRPTQLDLAGTPKRPMRHLRPPSESIETSRRSLSPGRLNGMIMDVLLFVNPKLTLSFFLS